MDRAKSLFFHMATTIKRKLWIAMQIIWLIYAYYLADFAMNELAERLQFHYGSNVPLTVLYYKAFVKNS